MSWNGIRVQWTLQQRQQNLEQAALERQTESSLQADLDYRQRTVQADIHQDVDRGGPSLGL